MKIERFKPELVRVISDCWGDDEAEVRLTDRIASLFHCPVNGVALRAKNPVDPLGACDLIAGGLLLGSLAALKVPAVIFVNFAPRDDQAELQDNGSPFVSFWIKEKRILVLSTTVRWTLSLAKKVQVIDELHRINVTKVVQWLKENGRVSKDEAKVMAYSQFRSLEVIPHVALSLAQGEEVPTTKETLAAIPNVSPMIWWVDNFGNCKTTLRPRDIDFKEGDLVATNFGTLYCSRALTDLPDGELGLVIGSSGYNEKKFLEIAVNGSSAADLYRLRPGDLLRFHERLTPKGDRIVRNRKRGKE